MEVLCPDWCERKKKILGRKENLGQRISLCFWTIRKGFLQDKAASSDTLLAEVMATTLLVKSVKDIFLMGSKRVDCSTESMRFKSHNVTTWHLEGTIWTSPCIKAFTKESCQWPLKKRIVKAYIWSRLIFVLRANHWSILTEEKPRHI